MIKKLIAGISGGIALMMGMTLAASAVSNVIVTPLNQQGWSSTLPIGDTRPGGAVNFIADTTAPGNPHTGALQLTTDATTTAKAQYMHNTNTPLSQITELSYYTKQVSASFPQGDPSYQLPVLLNGTSGFTTLVYEPYQNPTQGTVTNGVWQKWDVGSGLFWSTHTIVCSNGTILGTAGGPATYTLAAIKTACPSALAFQFGVNVGSNNPSYNVETDLFNFNGTTYNFEPTVGPPTSEKQCQNGGYQNFNNPSFSSQRACDAYVDARAHGDLTLANPHQRIKFHIANDQKGSGGEDENDGKVNTVEYWNYDYAPGVVLHYKAPVTCTNINPATGEARFVFQIPQGQPDGLSGQYVLAYVKDVEQKGVKDLYGHTATSDQTAANAWCQTGQGFTPTMYQVTSGSVEVSSND